MGWWCNFGTSRRGITKRENCFFEGGEILTTQVGGGKMNEPVRENGWRVKHLFWGYEELGGTGRNNDTAQEESKRKKREVGGAPKKG